MEEKDGRMTHLRFALLEYLDFSDIYFILILEHRKMSIHQCSIKTSQLIRFLNPSIDSHVLREST